jgi:hypothetical protein
LKDLSQNISVLAIGADWATEKTNLEPYSGPEDVGCKVFSVKWYRPHQSDTFFASNEVDSL